MPTDYLMSLADGLVAALQTEFAGAGVEIGNDLFPLSVAWPEDAQADLKDAELRNPLLWVVDLAESLGEERGVSCEDFQLLLILQMKIASPAHAATTTRQLSALMSRIARFVRPMTGPDDDNAPAFFLTVNYEEIPCVRAERKPARNLPARRVHRHYAELVTTWRRY